MKPAPQLVAAAREALYNNQGGAADDPFELMLESLHRRGLIHFAADLRTSATALLDAISYDVSGIDGRGGNGGLISTNTIRRSDELRQILLRQEATDG